MYNPCTLHESMSTMPLEFEGVLPDARMLYEMIQASCAVAEEVTFTFATDGLKWSALCEDDTVCLSAELNRSAWLTYRTTYETKTASAWSISVDTYKLLACLEESEAEKIDEVRMELSCGGQWLHCCVMSEQGCTEINMTVAARVAPCVYKADYENEWNLASDVLFSMLNRMAAESEICYIGYQSGGEAKAEVMIELTTPPNDLYPMQSRFTQQGLAREVNGKRCTAMWNLRLSCQCHQLLRMAAAGANVTQVTIGLQKNRPIHLRFGWSDDCGVLETQVWPSCVDSF